MCHASHSCFADAICFFIKLSKAASNIASTAVLLSVRDPPAVDAVMTPHSVNNVVMMQPSDCAFASAAAAAAAACATHKPGLAV